MAENLVQFDRLCLRTLLLPNKVISHRDPAQALAQQGSLPWCGRVLFLFGLE